MKAEIENVRVLMNDNFVYYKELEYSLSAFYVLSIVISIFEVYSLYNNVFFNYFSFIASNNLLLRFCLQKEGERFLEECSNSDFLEEIETDFMGGATKRPR